MLSFTARGAVRTPDTLQIRVGAGEGGALVAGAPSPSRSLTDAEVEANLRAFTEGRRTSRSRPCTHLVLSGCVGRVLSGIPERARSAGIVQLTIHGSAPPSLLEWADRVAVRTDTPTGIRNAPEHPGLALIVPTVVELMERLDEVVDALRRRAPPRVIFRWPLPGPGVEVPPLPALLTALLPAVDRLREEGMDARIGGLPACLGGEAPRRRTRNRFYVDADHQLEEALLFFPDIADFSKSDTCRTCAHTAWCDGVARLWLEQGRVGLLQPIAPEGAGG